MLPAVVTDSRVERTHVGESSPRSLGAETAERVDEGGSVYGFRWTPLGHQFENADNFVMLLCMEERLQDMRDARSTRGQAHLQHVIQQEHAVLWPIRLPRTQDRSHKSSPGRHSTASQQ